MWRGLKRPLQILRDFTSRPLIHKTTVNTTLLLTIISNTTDFLSQNKTTCVYIERSHR